MTMIDTHCHLCFDDLVSDVDVVLEAARGAGVSDVISSAFAPTDWPLQRALGAKEGVCIAQGVHPWVAATSWEDDALRACLEEPCCVAVGEVGLDYGAGRPSRSVQRETFGRQLRLAAELDLPLVLHCHRAFDDLFAMLDEYPRLRGGLHGYGRGIELAERCLERGLYLGFGAAILRESSERCRGAARALPPSSLLVESDAPSSRWPAGRASRPARVAEVVTALARLRGEAVEIIAEETTKNARELFGLDG